MNSCVLMAEIVSEPQLRSTQDNVDVAEMIVRFEGLRDEDPSSTIKVLGWGNLASDIKAKYNQGDRVVIEGRLSMNTIDLPEGYKEKRAELVASRIFALTGYSANTATSAPNLSMDSTAGMAINPAPRVNPPVVSSPTTQPSPIPQTQEQQAYQASPTPTETSASPDNADWDEIPFVRPVYSRTNFGSQLCDSWELEANRYWDGVKQFV